MAVDSSVIMEPRTRQTQTGNLPGDVFNRSYSNPTAVYAVARNIIEYLSSTGLYPLVVLKRYINPYFNLEAITYVPMHSNFLTLSDPQVVYGGDAYISEFTWLDLYEYDGDGNGANVNASLLGRVWLESAINYELRHSGNTSCNSVYTNGDRIADYWINKVAVATEEGNTYVARNPENICQEYYAYNYDYSKLNDESLTVGLSTTFDYCSKCLNEYPYRIMSSQKSFQEELTDSYRDIRTNNYTDILGSQGKIVKLAIDKDEMYCITSRYPIFVPTKTQRLTTNEDNIYVGTGDTLAIPPQRMVSTPSAYAGTSQRNAFVSNEYGLFYVDDITGKVIHIASGVNEISAQGMSAFFEENLPLQLKDQLNGLGISYPYTESTSSPYSIGVSLGWDPRFKRLLLHKRDYRLIEDKFLGILDSQTNDQVLYYNQDKIAWDEETKQFVKYEGANQVPVKLTNQNFFEDKSFTMSYLVPAKSWVSFHSYLPQWIFNDSNTFYTCIDNDIYKHNVRNYQRYYGNKKDFILDLIDVPTRAQSRVFAAMSVVCDVERYDTASGTMVQVEDKFFDRAVFYNSYQCSGQQFIAIKDPYFVDATTTAPVILAEKVDRTWNLNHIRDYTTQFEVPLFTSA